MDHTVSLAADEQPLRSIASLPGPRRLPLVGNALQIHPLRIHQEVERWCREYGPFFRMDIGRTMALVVADHDAVSEVLRNRPDGFRRPVISERVAREMGGLPGLFDAEGAEWRNQRRMVMQGFAPHAIKAYFPSLVKVALRLQRRWDGAAREGRAIDLAADLKRYTVDIIAGLAFGTEVNTIDGGEDVIQQYLDEILPALARRTFSPIPYWRYFRLPQDRRLDRAVAELTTAVRDLIAQARDRMAANPALAARPGNLLEAMIAASDQEGSGVNDEAVGGNVSTMLLAGEDTTANSIAWLLYLLRRSPGALERACEEVRRLAPDPAGFTIERMDALDYLDACVQESMRLKPVAPYMPLEALRETSVAGIHVPVGGLVWCVLRHDSVSDGHFPRAAEFDPLRWLPDANGVVAGDKRVPMPFGSGPRTCPGRYLALLEIKVAMAMILGRYDILAVDTPDGKEAGELMSFVMSPIGLTMRLRLRDGA
ncbi:cytochrome P450 [Pseudoduganella namucuonensis]|uniref:Cytochrome P450 n=1 Tax=Pseudoduganella namucuonensis TaxID=1035707 RepID=A0A1I7IM05_9BURK|nr:cytochrome P450 [Pseudoduganella namucuonensis]SFU73946.1 Cytochrome P450 [Pseudoduganella namucuonensis]